MLRYIPLVAMILFGCAGPTPKSVPFGLDRLPEVVSVATPLDVDNPELTIIHLLDWHYISPALYAAELRSRVGDVAQAESDRRYRRFLKDVEAVKADHVAVLRHLISHGVRAVYQEGLTPENIEAFEETARAVAAVERASLVDAIERAGRLRQEASVSGEAAELMAIAELALEQYDGDRLTVGASGALLADGTLAQVFPLEDNAVLIAANPYRRTARQRSILQARRCETT